METSLSNDTSLLQFSRRSDQFSSQIVLKNALSRNDKESFKIFPDVTAETNDFQKLTTSSCPLVKFHQHPISSSYVKLLTNRQINAGQNITYSVEVINLILEKKTIANTENVLTILTNSSDVAERPRCRVR